MHCPICNSSNLWKSKSANARLPLLLALLMVWVRCHNCGRKFLQFGLFPGRRITQ